jgi:predicted permease
LALRVLKNSPGFAAVAVLMLGLGIASNATVFGWIDSILLHPVPGAYNAHELAALEEVPPDGGTIGCAHPDFRDYQRNLKLVSGVVAAYPAFFTVGPIDHPRRVLGQVVSANYFAVLGVKPLLGRMFLPQEDRDDPGGFPLAVISARFWRGYFQADPGVVGRVVRVNGRQLTIVGVAPPEFAGTIGGAAMDMWAPLSMDVQLGTLNTWAAADRNARFVEVVVRLKPGVTIQQASAEAQAVTARIAAAYPDTHRGYGAVVLPMWRAPYGLQSALRTPLRILMIACFGVLLIACSNVANLLMARSVARHREFGIRIALGAGRARLVRLLLVEVLLLAGAGAVFGVTLAQWLGESLYALFPAVDAPVRAAIDPLLHTGLNPGVLAFTLLVAVGSAVLATIMPALAAGRVDVNEALREGGRTSTPGARSERTRSALVVVEVALAAVALIGAGLAVRSFQKFATLQTGFDSHDVLVAHFYLSTNGYSLKQEKQFCFNLRSRLESAPGIANVTNTDSVPLGLSGPPEDRVQFEGSSSNAMGMIYLPRTIVAPGYFSLMRIPLLEGRDFTDHDDLKTEPVIIVNQTFARRYFPGQDPIGRKVCVSGTWSTIVGLAKDSKYRNPPEGPTAFFYEPFRQMFFSGHSNFFFIRAAGGLDAARAALRREVAALDPNTGLYEASTLAEQTQFSLFAERLAAGLLSILAMLALAMAAVGLYSVVAYAMSERTQEIGIRMALGAQPREVVGMILRSGLSMALAGLAAGVVAAIAAVPLVSRTLDIPVRDADPLVFAAAPLFLLLIAFLACYLPARRATRVDPIATLRSE